MNAMVCTRFGDTKERVGFGDISAYIGHEAKAIAIAQSPSIITLETAAREMDLVAEMSGTRTHNPAYHYVLSWPASDKVANDAIFGSVRDSLTALGFDPDHMWVAAIHGDSQYQHVHVVVNRVHPATKRAHRPYLDHLTLSRFCREQEMKYGWTREAGLFEITGDGQIAQRSRTENGISASIDNRAIDSESWTGIMSFQRWVATAPAEALRDALASMPKTWSTVHAVLGDFDLAYIRYGRGAAIVDRTHAQYRAKASHLGSDFALTQIEKLLGPFQAARNRYPANPAFTYTAAREAGRLGLSLGADPRFTALYAQYNAVINEWEGSGKQRRARALAAVRARANQRLREHREERSAVQAGFADAAFHDPTTGEEIPRQSVRNAFAATLDEKLADIRAINKQERVAVVSEHRAPPALFRTWLKQQAAAGDADAIRAVQILRSGERVRVVEPQIEPIGQQPPEYALDSAVVDGESLMDVVDLETEIRQMTAAELEMGGSIRPDAGFNRQDKVDAITREMDAESMAREMDELAGSIRGAHDQSENERDGDKDLGKDPHGRYSEKYLAYIGSQKIPRILWEDQLARERTRATEIRSRMRDEFRAIKEDEQLGKDEKQSQRSLAQMEAAVALNNLNRTIAAERQMLHHLQVRHRIPSFADYLRHLAVRDPEAQTVLEAIEREGGVEDRGYAADASAITYLEQPSQMLSGVKSRASEDGSVVYTLPNGQEFQDVGKQLDIPKNDAQAIRAALLLSREKWVDGITVSGGKLFQLAVVREAAELGIAVTNPELQKAYEKFAEKAQKRREQFVQANAQQFAKAEATKVVFYESPDAHHKSFNQAVEQAALAVARDHGFNVSGISPRPDGLEGSVRAAWAVNDYVGYVVVETRTAGARLIQVDSAEVLKAQQNYDKAVKVNARDGAIILNVDPQRTQERSM